MWAAAWSQGNPQGPAHGCGPQDLGWDVSTRLGWPACFSASPGAQALELQALHLSKKSEVEAMRRAAGGGMGEGVEVTGPQGRSLNLGEPGLRACRPPVYPPPPTVLPPFGPRITNIPCRPTPAAAAWEGGTTADSRQPPETLNPFAPSRRSPPPRGGKSWLPESFPGSGDPVR